jgi:hypothetical protein
VREPGSSGGNGLTSAAGPARLRSEPLEQRYYDVARSLQVVLEEMALQLVHWWHERSGLDDLCGARLLGSGRRRPALLAMAAWTVMTGRFCARRLTGTSHAPRHVAAMVVTSALIRPQAIF